MIALGMFFVGLILLGVAGLHVIIQETVAAPLNMQLVTGLSIAGGALLIAGVVLWKRATRSGREE
jgi:hypothetical protein